jgi:hypothetical protein
MMGCKSVECRRRSLVRAAVAVWFAFAGETVRSAEIDVVGISPGMPLRQAVEVLKTHNPRMNKLQPSQVEFDLMPGKPIITTIFGNETLRYKGQMMVREEITIEAAPGPDPAVVTGVYRVLQLLGEEVTTKANVLMSLEKKYGTHMVPAQKFVSVGFVDFLWYFDANGKPFKPTTPCDPQVWGRQGHQMGSNASAQYIRHNIANLPQLTKWSQDCKTIVYVYLRLHDTNKDLVTSITTYMSNEILRTERFRATADQLQRLSSGQKQKEVQDAGSRGAPKL